MLRIIFADKYFYPLSWMQGSLGKIKYSGILFSRKVLVGFEVRTKMILVVGAEI
jgi:hypothetical protein